MFGFVRGAFKHPNEEIAAIAEEALTYFNTYGNMLRMNQTKETGLLDNLITDLKGMGDAKLTKAGLKPFLDDLEQKELDYRASVSARSDEEGERLLGIVKEKRAAALPGPLEDRRSARLQQAPGERRQADESFPFLSPLNRRLYALGHGLRRTSMPLWSPSGGGRLSPFCPPFQGGFVRIAPISF